MAGRKQHFIPQRLLREFAAVELPGKKPKVWVFPRSAEAFRCATDGAAAQRHFYSELSGHGGPTLDDKITAYEQELSPAYEHLQALSVGEAASAPIVAEFVTHLTIRNAHVRDVFRLAVGGLAEGALEMFTDPAWVSEAMGLSAEGGAFDRAIDDALATHPQLKGQSAALLRPMLRSIAKKELPNLTASMATAFGEAFGGLGDPAELIREKHNELLTEELSPPVRRAFLERLAWRVVAAPAEGSILPDCVAVWRTTAGKSLPFLLMAKEDTPVAVIVPVSSDRVLVGAPDDRPTPRLDHLNRELAGASQNFFVAKHRLGDAAELQAMIGRATEQFMRATWDAVLTEIRTNPAEALKRAERTRRR